MTSPSASQLRESNDLLRIQIGIMRQQLSTRESACKTLHKRLAVRPKPPLQLDVVRMQSRPPDMHCGLCKL